MTGEREMTAMGHEEQFLPLRLSAGFGFIKKTFAGPHSNGRDAPTTGIRRTADNPRGSALLGHFSHRAGTALLAPEADDMASAFRAAANLAITFCCAGPRTRHPDKFTCQ